MGVINQEMLERARRRTASRGSVGHRQRRPLVSASTLRDSGKATEFMPSRVLAGHAVQIWKIDRPEVVDDPFEESLNRAIINSGRPRHVGGWFAAKIRQTGRRSTWGYRALKGGSDTHIEECTEEQSDMFAQAISEVFGPIDDAPVHVITPRCAFTAISLFRQGKSVSRVS